jgi:hypothetical protein
VAGSRDPDAMAQEIEQTRAELAAAVDAIAQRVNPKRLAARAADMANTTQGRLVAVLAAMVVITALLRRRRAD